MQQQHALPPNPCYTVKSPIQYHTDLTNLYHQLCQDRPATLLLESAEIKKKSPLASRLIINSALRIHALGQRVILEALTANGEHLLRRLSPYLAQPHFTLTIQPQRIQIDIITSTDAIDEDSRLKTVNVFDVLRAVQSFGYSEFSEPKHFFVGGLFAYDLIGHVEQLPPVKTTTHCPDYCFYVAEHAIMIDHKNHCAQLISSVFLTNDNDEKQAISLHHQTLVTACNAPLSSPEPISLTDHPLTVNYDDQAYKDIVRSLKTFILKGDVFQVVPSRKFRLACPSPLRAYHTLKQHNPSPYLFYLQDNDFVLFGASPESALKYEPANRQIEIYPIAGTRARGRNHQNRIDPDLDSRIELTLRTDEKELAEHMMLVDLARNDLARICEPGSRYVAELTQIDRYTHVMHLVSRVVGTLRHDLDIFHAYQACMNMGTLTGAPKVRAMQLIAQYEGERRGNYGGAVGYFTGQGDFDTCIVIRSAYVEKGIATIQAGGGVVLESDPQSEADETRHKAQAVIRAIQHAHHPVEAY